MIKIIFAEDEYYFRKSLLSMLQWEELGFIVAGEAKNGEEALEIIEKTKPEIGIFDIDMPYMNGLELSRILNDRGDNIKKVVLTGYDSFEFARRSIDLGIEKYILKPVSPEDLKSVLLEMKNQIEMEQRKNLEWNYLKEQLAGRKPIFIDQAIQQKKHNSAESVLTAMQREQILMAMKAGLKDKVLVMLDSIFLHLRDLSSDIILHSFKCLELVSICMEYTAENSLDFTQKLGDYHHTVQEIENRKSLEARHKYIKDIFIMAMNLVSEGKASERLEFSKNVMVYIDENIMNCELDIEMVANRFFVNYSHLCRCFKKEAGLTVNEYITGIRLKKAKDLMDEGFHVVQHVSYKVGYSDPNYFTKCFRKYFGISPHQYIESIIKKYETS